MKFQFLTIFPEIFNSYFSKGMIRVAQEKKLIKIKTHNLRDYAVDKYGTVDDRPYGGGPGQVMMVEPVYKALKKICKSKHPLPVTMSLPKCARQDKKTKIILLSARGKTWNQQLAQKFSKLDEIIFVCPRYEGHDERIRKLIDEEISIGDYILTGGELGAMVIVDSIMRLIPGVLGKQESLSEESHSTPMYLEYPHYTRPEIFEYKKGGEKMKHRVPGVLLSGHHAKINEWRKQNSKNS